MNMLVKNKTMKDEKLPSHIPIKINTRDIQQVKLHFIREGYRGTFLQILKPKQLWGIVKKVPYNGKIIEHHIRCYVDGTITTEYEFCRVDDMWNHLTTESYSAHEKLIEILDELGINFQIDNELREKYNKFADNTFPKKYSEFFIWLFEGVIFWTPLGYLWKFGYNTKLWLQHFFVKKIAIPTNAGD